MKKLLAIITILILNFNLPSYSFDFSILNFKEKPEYQIRSLLKKHNKAMDNHDIQTIKTFYDENYKSADGFDLETLLSMLEKTYGTYNDIKYKTKINNITTYDNWALVQMSDRTNAKIYPTEDKKK